MRILPIGLIAALLATPAIGGPLAYAACQTGTHSADASRLRVLPLTLSISKAVTDWWLRVTRPPAPYLGSPPSGSFPRFSPAIQP
jgi:hypothetical protein